MGSFFAELKRRQMFRVAAAYAVVAWVILQVVNNLAPGLNLPNWAITLVIVLLGAGFPVALLFCWIQQLAPADGAQTQAKVNRLDWILVGGLAAVIALLLYQQLAPAGTTTADGKGDAGRAAQTSAGTGISVAVLPFANLSDEREQEFFSDGMTDEIMTALAKIQKLSVVARESAHQYKGERNDIRAVGRALNAQYLINGSVRRAGNRVRITAQLVRAADGVGLWTDSFDRELTDIFAIQEDIAQAIAGALKVPLGLQPGEALVSNRAIDVDSYQQYLRASALRREGAPDRAIAILEAVVARDPAYAPAWAALARAYLAAPAFTLVLRSGTVEDARRMLETARTRAEASAERAIELDSRSALGYATRAAAQSWAARWAQAEDLYRRALALDPSDPDVLSGYRNMLSIVGRLREALRISEQARMLEPFAPIYLTAHVEMMLLNGQSNATIPILEALPNDPIMSYSRNSDLARAYAAQGRFTEAADTILAIAGNLVDRQSMEDAARLIRTSPSVTADPKALPVIDGALNFVYAYVGARERMLDRADRNLQTGSTATNYWLWDPLYAPLRKTERFKELMRDTGLADYWRARGWPDLCRPVGTDDFECE